MRALFLSLLFIFTLCVNACQTTGPGFSSTSTSSEPPANLLEERDILASQRSGEIWFSEDGRLISQSQFVDPNSRIQSDIPAGSPLVGQVAQNMAHATASSQPGLSRAAAPKIQTEIDPVTGRTIQIPAVGAYMQGNQVVEGRVLPYSALKNVSKVKVAILVPLSGEHASVGKSLLNAAQLALFDIAGDHFELMPRDTKSTSAGAVEAAQSAVDKGAQLILGPLFADDARAVKPIIEQANLQMITFSTDWKLADRSTYVMGFTPFDQVRRVMAYAASQGKVNQALLAPTTEYGDLVANAFQQSASQAGAKVSHVQRYRVGEENLNDMLRAFSLYDARKDGRENRIAELEAIPSAERTDYQRDELSRLKMGSGAMAMPFDALMLPVGGDDAKAITSILNYYDVNPANARFLGTGLWDDANLGTELSMHGAWFAAPSPENRTRFESQYVSVYGSTPPRIASLAYDATALAAIVSRQAIAKGSDTFFARSDLTNPNGFMGVDGIFRFQNSGLVERGLAVLEIAPEGRRVISPAPTTFESINN